MYITLEQLNKEISAMPSSNERPLVTPSKLQYYVIILFDDPEDYHYKKVIPALFLVDTGGPNFIGDVIWAMNYCIEWFGNISPQDLDDQFPVENSRPWPDNYRVFYNWPFVLAWKYPEKTVWFCRVKE